jgi:hypothetical protein
VISLTVDHFLQIIRVPFPLHRNLRRCIVDLSEFVGGKGCRSGSDIFFEARQLRCTRNRNDPRLLRKQLSKRDLSRCRLLLLRESAEQIHACLIRFSVLRRKARDDVAKVVFLELRCGSREKPSNRWPT